LTGTAAHPPRSDPPAPAEWDVFLSYCRSDAVRVGPLVSALRASGLRVFVDQDGIPHGGAISAGIVRALAGSKILLAIYSAEYPRRPVCRRELTAAYLAGQAEGDPSGRVLVVNPERDGRHIEPFDLRDHRYWTLGDGAAMQDIAAVQTIADAAAQHAAAAGGALGAWIPGHGGRRSPDWYGEWPRVGPKALAGRHRELWAVHSALLRHTAPLTAGDRHPSEATLRLRGMPGIGKSALALEYALRFGAAYPGGMYWFDVSGEHRPEDERAAYRKLLRGMAHRLGVSLSSGRSPTAALRRHFERLGQRFLWVVDGLSGSAHPAQLGELQAPHPLGCTLYTVRAGHFTEPSGSSEGVLDLGPLETAESVELLISEGGEMAPAGAIHAEARLLAEQLGGHPGALRLASLLTRHTPVRAVRTALAGGGASPLDEVSDLGAWPAPASDLPFTAELLHDAVHGGLLPTLDVLRIAAALGPVPVRPRLAAEALSRSWRVSPAAAVRQVEAGLAHAERLGLLVRPSAGAVAHGTEWLLPPVVAHALRHADPDPLRAAELREQVLHILAAPADREPTRLGAAGHVRSEGEADMREQLSRPAHDLERMAAFDLQSEIALRVGRNPLEDGEGILREALGSLKALVEKVTETVQQYNVGLAEVAAVAAGPSSPEGSRTVHQIANTLVNEVLRPFLSTWHPRLTAYEAERPEGVNSVEHEQRWPLALECRTALAELRAPLRAVEQELAAVSGADFG
jgi:hypothetical protein